MRVNQQLETLEAWDPRAIDPRGRELYRRQYIVRTGEMKRARQMARQAVTLARTRPETCRALRTLARIECDLDLHQEELRHAQAVVRLSPRDPLSWSELLHAAHCTGRDELENRAGAALKALGGYPPVSTGGSERLDSNEPIPPTGRTGLRARRR
jgi:hypothetical protein